MTATMPVPDLTSLSYGSGPQIVTPDAVEFLRALHARFEPTRVALLEARQRRQEGFDRGEFPHFLPETEHIRNSDWRVAPIPQELLDRRVEITGPAERFSSAPAGGT